MTPDQLELERAQQKRLDLARNIVQRVRGYVREGEYVGAYTRRVKVGDIVKVLGGGIGRVTATNRGVGGQQVEVKYADGRRTQVPEAEVKPVRTTAPDYKAAAQAIRRREDVQPPPESDVGAPKFPDRISSFQYNNLSPRDKKRYEWRNIEGYVKKKLQRKPLEYDHPRIVKMKDRIRALEAKGAAYDDPRIVKINDQIRKLQGVTPDLPAPEADVGRGPAGRVRNVRAMGDDKLKREYLGLLREGGDPEARDAFEAELNKRFAAKATSWSDPKLEAMFISARDGETRMQGKPEMWINRLEMEVYRAEMNRRKELSRQAPPPSQLPRPKGKSGIFGKAELRSFDEGTLQKLAEKYDRQRMSSGIQSGPQARKAFNQDYKNSMALHAELRERRTQGRKRTAAGVRQGAARRAMTPAQRRRADAKYARGVGKMGVTQVKYDKGNTVRVQAEGAHSGDLGQVTGFTRDGKFVYVRFTKGAGKFPVEGVVPAGTTARAQTPRTSRSEEGWTYFYEDGNWKLVSPTGARIASYGTEQEVADEALRRNRDERKASKAAITVGPPYRKGSDLSAYTDKQIVTELVRARRYGLKEFAKSLQAELDRRDTAKGFPPTGMAAGAMEALKRSLGETDPKAKVRNTAPAKAGDKNVPIWQIPVGSLVKYPGEQGAGIPDKRTGQARPRRVGSPVDNGGGDIVGRYHDGVQWDYVGPNTRFDVVSVPSGKGIASKWGSHTREELLPAVMRGEMADEDVGGQSPFVDDAAQNRVYAQQVQEDIDQVQREMDALAAQIDFLEPDDPSLHDLEMQYQQMNERLLQYQHELDQYKLGTPAPQGEVQTGYGGPRSDAQFELDLLKRRLASADAGEINWSDSQKQTARRRIDELQREITAPSINQADVPGRTPAQLLEEIDMMVEMGWSSSSILDDIQDDLPPDVKTWFENEFDMQAATGGGSASDLLEGVEARLQQQAELERRRKEDRSAESLLRDEWRNDAQREKGLEDWGLNVPPEQDVPGGNIDRGSKVNVANVGAGEVTGFTRDGQSVYVRFGRKAGKYPLSDVTTESGAPATAAPTRRGGGGSSAATRVAVPVAAKPRRALARDKPPDVRKDTRLYSGGRDTDPGTEYELDAINSDLAQVARFHGVSQAEEPEDDVVTVASRAMPGGVRNASDDQLKAAAGILLNPYQDEDDSGDADWGRGEDRRAMLAGVLQELNDRYVKSGNVKPITQAEIDRAEKDLKQKSFQYERAVESVRSLSSPGMMAQKQRAIEYRDRIQGEIDDLERDIAEMRDRMRRQTTRVPLRTTKRTEGEPTLRVLEASLKDKRQLRDQAVKAGDVGAARQYQQEIDDILAQVEAAAPERARLRRSQERRAARARRKKK